MMRAAWPQTASIASSARRRPTSTSSSRNSSFAVTAGSTSARSACSRMPNSAKPRLVGTMCLPLAVSRSCRLRPWMTSARVAGVPMPVERMRMI